jgi:small subunit ribosomal protein S16
MAMKIRLTRRGSKKNPIYRVVVADVRAPRDGRSIATIGRYDPKPNPSFIEIDTDAAREWIAKGALPTNTVAKLLKIAGVQARDARATGGTGTRARLAAR